MDIVTSKTKEAVKIQAVKVLLRKGIETDRELWFLISEVFGVRIPFETCCEEHDSLWEFVKADFFSKYPKLAARAARGAGKTFSVGITKSAKLVALPGIRISNFAASENQGHALFRAVTQALGPSAPSTIQELVGELLTANVEMRPRAFPGTEGPNKASRMRVLVGTMKGVNSEHVDDLVVDERAQMENAIFSEAMGMMTPADPFPGTLTVISSVKALGDPMDVLMSNAEDMGYKAYTSCILDVMTCREKNCDGCKATRTKSNDGKTSRSFYDYCQGRLLGRSLGHVTVAGARMKFTEMGLEAADAQLFCASPEGTERAFPAWSPDNIKDLTEVINRGEVSGFYVFGDFGKRHDSCWQKAYFIPSMQTIYVEEELVGSNRTIQEWIPELKENGWGPRCLAFLVDIAGRQTTITSKKSAIDHLEDEGWIVVAEKMDEVDTTDRLRDLVRDGRFVVHPRCKKTIEAFNRATNKSLGQGDNKTYLKVIKDNKFADRIDAARYGSNLLSPDDRVDAGDTQRMRGRR